MRYRALSKQIYTSKIYSLVPIRYEDIFLIKKWRNEQINILRQKKSLSNEDQKNYYQKTILKLFDNPRPPQFLFSLIKDDKCIGYGGLVHISWDYLRGEVSFLLETDRVKNSEIYENEFSIFLDLIKKVAFEVINFERIFTETFDVRNFHVSILEKNGFVLEGRLRNHAKFQNEFVDSLIHGFLKNDYINDI